MSTNFLPVSRFHPASSFLWKWRLMTSLWYHGGVGRLLARLIRLHLQWRYSCDISPQSIVGRNVFLPHPLGIVIGDGVLVENGVTIYQNVTLGRNGEAGKCPRIGESAIIFAGAVVIGDIIIGSNSIIGANSVVRSNVPEGATAVGVPARILCRQINP